MIIPLRFIHFIFLIFWAPLFIRPFWVAGFWSLALVTALGWLEKANGGRLGKLPLSVTCLTGWVLLQAAVNGWRILPEKGILPGLMLFPIGCVLLAVMAFQWMRGWTEEESGIALNTLRISLGLMVFWGWVQAFNLDQWSSKPGENDIIFGTLGNPTLFAGLLSMSLPLWLWWKSRFRWAMSLLTFALIIKCLSITALTASILVLLYRFKKRWKLVLLFSPLFVLCLRFLIPLFPPSFLNAFGRFEAWQGFLSVWADGPADTGLGLGTVWGLSGQWPSQHVLYEWTHVHCEGLQILVELGIVGFGLFLWVLWDASRRLNGMYGGILIASLFCSLTSFTWHLAQTGFLTLWALSQTFNQAEAEHGIS